MFFIRPKYGKINKYRVGYIIYCSQHILPYVSQPKLLRAFVRIAFFLLTRNFHVKETKKGIARCGTLNDIHLGNECTTPLNLSALSSKFFFNDSTKVFVFSHKFDFLPFYLSHNGHVSASFPFFRSSPIGEPFDNLQT